MKFLDVVLIALVQVALIRSSFASCGISKVTDSYPKSVEAKVGAFPWSAFIVYQKNGVYCNAVLIDKRHVLASLHCMESSMNATFIGLGGHDVTSVLAGECEGNICPDGRTSLFGIEKVIPHPSYIPRRHHHDVAIVRLDRDVDFNDHISPICLPSDIENFSEGDKVVAVGWGKKTWEGELENIQQVIVGIVSNWEECKTTYSDSRFELSDAEFCSAVETDGDPDTCVGFTGSPIMSKIGEKWILHGLVTLGKECNLKSSPNVNIRASFYNDWIKNAKI